LRWLGLIGGSMIDTVPRFGNLASQSTFLVLVIKPMGALRREEVVEAIKSSVKSVTARGRFANSGYRTIKALNQLTLREARLYHRTVR
jgi:hypothetical protein